MQLTTQWGRFAFIISEIFCEFCRPLLRSSPSLSLLNHHKIRQSLFRVQTLHLCIYLIRKCRFCCVSWFIGDVMSNKCYFLCHAVSRLLILFVPFAVQLQNDIYGWRWYYADGQRSWTGDLCCNVGSCSGNHPSFIQGFVTRLFIFITDRLDQRVFQNAIKRFNLTLLNFSCRLTERRFLSDMWTRRQYHQERNIRSRKQIAPGWTEN